MRTRLSLSGQSVDPLATLTEAAAAEGEPSDGARQLAVFGRDVEVDQPARFSQFVDGIRDESPTLHYAHLLVPHQPFNRLPDGSRYRDLEPDLGKGWDSWLTEDPALPAHVRQRHVLQTMDTDRLLGELIATLQARGLYDDVLLVVVADHGISFDAGGPVRATIGQVMTDEAAAQLMSVPFFLKEPGQRSGGPVDGNVWTADVVPTIADVLDADIPFEVDGRSALGRPRAHGPTAFYVNNTVSDSTNVRGTQRAIDSDVVWDTARRRAVDRFLPPGDELRPFRTGPRPDLVGTPAEALPEGADRVDVALETGVDLEIAADDAELPAMMRGTAPEAGDELAVVVNGTVGATARAGPDRRFHVVVPGSVFRLGPNEVETYLLP
jgi:hypothetical protein